jgi:hypothetical protein
MRDDLNIDLIFPIRDDVSAGLMCVKAELLYDAGIINARELNVVIGRAAAIIDQAEGAESRQTIGNQYSGSREDFRKDLMPELPGRTVS